MMMVIMMTLLSFEVHNYQLSCIQLNFDISVTRLMAEAINRNMFLVYRQIYCQLVTEMYFKFIIRNSNMFRQHISCPSPGNHKFGRCGRE